MKKFIKGKIRKIIYSSTTGYNVGLFRLKETNDIDMQDFLNKSCTFTGNFVDLDLDSTYVFYGKLHYNEKYGYQYEVIEYKKEELTNKDALYDFLTSGLIKGVGEKTAQGIIDTFGDEALSKIQENYTNLYLIPNMTEKRALNIYDAILKYGDIDKISVELSKYGFNSTEILQIFNKYANSSIDIVKNNPYNLKDIISFDKLDKAYLTFGNPNSVLRVEACFIEVLKRLEYSDGDIYFYKDEIKEELFINFGISISEETFTSIVEILVSKKEIVLEEDRFYLLENYKMEKIIANSLIDIYKMPQKDIPIFETEITKLEKKLKVTYNAEQKDAIRSALENRITVITGGPGTGKSTIVKAITHLYIKMNKIAEKNIGEAIALLAPTGRAAKKLSESTGLNASTIHRYLKWNKDSNEFQVNEFNKNYQRLIIIDEMSMVDMNLFCYLLKGITNNIQLVLVGDSSQLPSVGAGQVLNDIIASEVFTNCKLNYIYRQSNNSYIPILANEIKNKSLSPDFIEKKDDYNFFSASGQMIRDTITRICQMYITKGLTDRDIQVLAPMYKGLNGIDNINVLLRNLFNPSSSDKKEIRIGEVIYRVGDKVLQLVNDPDKGVYNGDIGYIDSIDTIKIPRESTVIKINFDNNSVLYKKEDMFYVKHAYAISIHKSQGSEFSYVILPICNSYRKMLYNKLIYTGVSRAKKTLVIIGEEEAFKMAIDNDYATNRKTTLKLRILNNI